MPSDPHTFWLLESDVFGEDLEEMKTEIIHQGMFYRVEKYIPFRGGEYNLLFEKDDLVIFYGSLNMASQLQEDPIFHPRVFCTLENYDCSNYYAHLGRFLLNKDYIMLPFLELKRRKDFIFDAFGLGGTIFVRPDNGTKSFTGQLLVDQTFEKDYNHIGAYNNRREDLVIVASPKIIIAEWRLVIAEMKIIASSMYQKDGKKFLEEGCPKGVTECANKVLEKGYEPDVVWTMDICMTADEKLHLLEINSFSCSGLYACNVAPVIKEVTRIAKGLK